MGLPKLSIYASQEGAVRLFLGMREKFYWV
jgi:hypothetical protein